MTTPVNTPELLRLDAGNRALRSFLQGFGIDIIVAIAATTLVIVNDLDNWKGWTVVGITFGKTIAQAGASYVMRRFMDSSKIPTPLPPSPTAPPSDPVEGAVAYPAGFDPKHDGETGVISVGFGWIILAIILVILLILALTGALGFNLSVGK